MLALGVLVAFAPHTEAQGAAPAWSTGNYWNYTGFIHPAPTTWMNETVNYTVVGQESVTVSGTAYTCYNGSMVMMMTVTMLPNPPTTTKFTGSSYFRTSDLAVVKQVMLTPAPSTSTYDPPQKIFTFPLSNGQQWSQTIWENGTFNLQVTRDYNVTGPTSVTVPAGTFNAFNVTGVERGVPANSTTYFYTDVVGFAIRISTPMTGIPFVMDLQAYSYTANNPPTKPTMTITPATIYCRATVAFVALSTDPDTGDTITYAWQFGDGTTAAGATTTHAYSAAGSYVVNVTASDNKGAASPKNSTTLTVTEGVPGTIAITFSPSSPNTGDTITFVALAIDPDGDTVTYTWDFGDGTTGTGATVTHSYSDAKDYTVKVNATDGHGGLSTGEVKVTVGSSSLMLYLIIIIIIIVIVIIIAVALSRRKKAAQPPMEQQPPMAPPPQ
jgi:PKD repeat protein